MLADALLRGSEVTVLTLLWRSDGFDVQVLLEVGDGLLVCCAEAGC